MTDKVQKIREEVERLRNLHQIKYQKLDTNDNMCLVECGKRNLCNELLSFIDSLQEEPVSSIWHDASEPPIIDKTFLLVAPNGNSSLCLWGGKELHSVTIGGGHSVLCRGDIYSYIDDLLNLDNSCNFGKNLQEEPVSNPTPNEKMSVERWKKACEAACCDINYRSHYGLTETRDDYFVDGVQWADEHPKEEPVSEDLKEVITTKFDELIGGQGEFDKVYIEGLAKAVAIECGFAGAKWQKEQFEKNRLAACDRQTEEEAEIEQSFVMGIIENEHRQPTFDDAIKYGMRLQKKQLMANTADAMIGLPYENKDGGYTHLIDVSRPLPVGSNKIAIIFKED